MKTNEPPSMQRWHGRKPGRAELVHVDGKLPRIPNADGGLTTTRLLVIGLLFVLITWAGAAGIAYGVVEMTGGQGPQGVPGAAGEQGVAGPPGERGLPGDDAAQLMVKRLASMWAVQQVSAINGGAFVEFSDPAVDDCVQYVLTGEGSFSRCAGFYTGQ